MKTTFLTILLLTAVGTASAMEREAVPKKARAVIKKFGLEPLEPEGGWWKQTYRPDEEIEKSALPDRYDGPRKIGTSILYLMTRRYFSTLHRMKSDEIWHFHGGNPAEIVTINDEGHLDSFILGVEKGEPQRVIAKGLWFAGKPMEEDGYTLMGCTVAPGFEYEDFEMGEREKLTELFPKHKEVIEEFAQP